MAGRPQAQLALLVMRHRPLTFVDSPLSCAGMKRLLPCCSFVALAALLAAESLRWSDNEGVTRRSGNDDPISSTRTRPGWSGQAAGSRMGTTRRERQTVRTRRYEVEQFGREPKVPRGRASSGDRLALEMRVK